MDAPGELGLVQRFVNTADLDQGTDRLQDDAGFSGWLAESGLARPEATFGPGDRERVVAFRESLRALLLANHGDDPDRDAVEVPTRAARDAPLVVAFDAGGTARLTPAQAGVDGVLAALLAIVARAQAEGTWPRLKACPNDSCRWAFYDRSRNRSRTWCAMSVCGNRAKARSYRARHR
jgi:predicted RNA-binding Zn ribbon-like protein